MKKKPRPTALVVAESKNDNVVVFQISPELTVFAQGVLHVDLNGSHDERANVAAEHMNRSQRHALAAGLLLASIKVECEHGQFTAMLEARGFELRSAQRAMLYAQFVLSQPEAIRLRLIEMPRAQVMEIAGADPEVIEQLLDDGGDDRIDTLSVRALRDRIRDLEASTTDLQVQRDTAEAEAEGLRKRIKRGPGEREDMVPVPVADMRAEIMALGKKAALSLDSFNALAIDLVQMMGSDEAHDWADATLRLALSQLVTLRLQIDGLAVKYLREVAGGDPTPVRASYLTKQEVLESAKLFSQLTQVHDYEAKLREWQREQEQPRAKGRPKAKPVAPAGAGGAA